MYFVLQQTDVSESLSWNPIDAEVLCPIHEHFKIAPCMFRTNSNLFNSQNIGAFYIDIFFHSVVSNQNILIAF